MSFELSLSVDKNKIFLVKRCELEGRLDPVFYNSTYTENEKGIKNSIWNHKKIGKISSRIVDGPFGSDLKVEEYQESGIPLLRVSNIRTGEIAGELVFISEEKQNQLKRSKVCPNDVLLTKAGAILGYSAVFPKNLKEGNITSHLVTISCNPEINPHYLSHFFRSRVGQLQIYRWGNKSTRPELNTGEVKNILVTIPPIEVQNKIVSKMNEAHEKKKQKETESQQLLDSIDDYLSTELGIELPEPVENMVRDRIFFRKFSDVTGRRFDPDYFQILYNRLNNSLCNGHFNCLSLREITTLITNGNTPASSDYSESKTSSPIIKVRSYEGDLISLKKLAYTKTKKIKQAKKNDVFVLSAAHQASYVGRFIKYLDSTPLENTSFVGELICIRANESVCNPIYLFSLLNMEPYKILLNKEKTGQTSHIYPKDIKHIKIPVPPLNKQAEIAKHITEICNQAKQLQLEAIDDLEKVKQDVEALILGETKS